MGKFIEVQQTDDDMRRYGEPHPHWQKNLEYAEEQLRTPYITEFLDKNSIAVYWDGTRKNFFGQWEVLTLIGFSWDKKEGRFNCPISLHQAVNKFIEQWEKFFHITDGGPISKRGIYSPPAKRMPYND